MITKFRRLVLAFSCVATVGACQEETVPIGPITTYEGTPIGVLIEDIADHSIEVEQRELFAGSVLVGVVRDFIPHHWRYSPDGWTALHNATLYYDLNTRLVFQMEVVANAPFFEADCRAFGQHFLTNVGSMYEDVRVTMEGAAYGAVWIMPARSQVLNGREQQNFINAGCPLGFRLTPNEPTFYTWTFANGYLLDQVLSDG